MPLFPAFEVGGVMFDALWEKRRDVVGSLDPIRQI